jgi:hypothetical protein
MLGAALASAGAAATDDAVSIAAKTDSGLKRESSRWPACSRKAARNPSGSMGFPGHPPGLSLPLA